MREATNLILRLVAIALLESCAATPLAAQSLEFPTLAQLAAARQRLTASVQEHLKANQPGTLLDELGELVRTERALIASFERSFPWNGDWSLYYTTIIYLRISLSSNLRSLAALEQDRDDLGALRAHAGELAALDVRLYGPDHWETGDARRLLADCRRLEGLDPAQRGELRQAKELNREVLRLSEEGRWLDAFPLAEKALAIRERYLGADHPEYATSLNNLAGLYEALGDEARTESLYRRALEIRARALGEHHPYYANSLNNLGYFFIHTGDYEQAEPLVRQALAVNRETLGEDHAETAASLANLAGLEYERGAYEKAERLFRQELDLVRRGVGTGDPRYALSLSNLASVLKAQGRHAEAESLYRQALEIRGRTLQEDHPLHAASLNDLAVLELETGRLAEAEAHLRRALEIRRRRPGARSLEAAQSLSNLAELLAARGDRAGAESLCRQALEIRTALLGPAHPFVALLSSRLARFLAAQGKWDDAAEVMDRSRRILRESSGRLLPALSDRQRQSFLAVTHRYSYFSALTLGLERAQDAKMAERSAAWVVNGKAIIPQLLAEREVLARGTKDPGLAETIRQLHAVRAALANLALAGAQPGKEAEYQRQLDTLAQQDETLSRQLGQSRGLGERASTWVELDAVRGALPADAVLVEFAAFIESRLPAPGEVNEESTLRYAAWIVPPAGQGAVQLIDLGPGGPIEQAMAPYREALRAGSSAIDERGEAADEVEFKKRLDALARLVLRPLEPVLSNYTRWLISPDASLWLLPWSALPAADGRYCIERHTISTLISGRDLVLGVPVPEGDAARASGGLVIADPDFLLEALPRPHALAGLLTRGSSLPLPYDWPRLPGTAAEATAVMPRLARFLGERPALFTGAEAIEAALKSVRHPRVVVASTHGFFLKDQDLGILPSAGPGLSLGPNGMGGGDLGLQGPVVRSAPAPADANVNANANANANAGPGLPENPLLRCGLVLAGADERDHATDPRGDDGILTGLEIAGIDLRGTELVVLSACETARGIIHIGEGVASLRQAFQIAGARTVVATLWQIPDAETVALMTRFWDNLAAGNDADDSLRSAQLGLIQERLRAGQTAHPFFWAAFTLTGQTTFRKTSALPGRTR